MDNFRERETISRQSDEKTVNVALRAYHASFSFSDLCFCFPKVALKVVLGCILTRNLEP